MLNIYVLSEGLQNKILKEMSDPRKKALHYIDSKCDSIREHFLKAIIFKNTTNNLVGWEKTIANILNYCNGITTKTKSGKFKKEQYLEYLFGIDNSFDEKDAYNMIYGFELDFGDKFPKFERTPELTKEVFTKYNYFSDYFSTVLSTDRGNEDRMNEFQMKVKEIIGG